MPGRWDIWFRVALAVVLFVFVHVIWAAVCCRWKLARARREEVEHLARLAAEEAVREEMEATHAYVPASSESTGVEYIGGTCRFECAVCHRSTSTRCSRCKTVRYCSGTCQIIHWRRGHKNECHLPQVDHQDKLQESNSHLPWLQPEKSWLLDNTFKNEQMSRTNPVATRFGGLSSDSKISNYVAGDNDIKDIRSFLDSSRTDSSRGSFVDSSSSCSTFPGLSHDIAYEGQEKATIANLGTNSQCPSNHKNIGAEFDASCPETPSKHSDHNGTLGTNSTHEHSSVNALDGTKEPNLRDCSAMGPDKSGFGPTRKGADDWLLKARRLRSLSVSFADRAFYGGRRHSVIDDSSSKVNNASTMAPKFSKSAGFVPNSKSDLRTSVKSIVRQLKPSLTSVGFSSMPMNFPYELFAKLYNSDKVDMDPFGLFNCGNSCFANAVLQCLVFTRPLSAYLLEGFHRAKCSRKGWCFTCEFENLILKGKQGQSPLSPVGILSHIDRIGSHLALGREEDAHEFLRYAIDAMQYTSVEETGDVADKFCEDANLIQLTFGGYLRSEINCMKCKAKSVQLERMMDLTVEIEGDIRTLEQALKQFTTTEVLNGENSYRCDRCKSFERAKKKLSVVEAPNILTIALKRFQLGKFGKLNKSVRFPVHLDLAPYMSRVDPCPLYNLYAVVVHVDVMNAAFSGHYICYVESMKGKWYMINDREVRPVELQRVLKENAYLLFYARKSPHAPSLIKNERHQVPLNTSGWFKKPTNFEHTHRKLSSMAHQNHDHLSRATVPSDFAGGRLYFPRTDSFSDSLSLSCSEEGSWTTESTRNSTSADELSDYLFGGAQQSTDECDYFSHSPSLSGHYRGNHSFKHILYSDRTFATGMLKENYRDDESSPYGGRSSVLMRSSTVNERRHQTLY